MLLHLSEDEKFTDEVINMFETVSPGNNHYYINIPSEDYILKYTKTNHPNVIVATTDSAEFQKITTNITHYNAVILHNLYNPYKQKIVKNAPDCVLFHWMVWGADLYCIPPFDKTLYSKETSVFNKQQRNINGRIGDFMNKNFHYLWTHLYLRPRNLFSYVDYKNIIVKIRSCSTVLPEEVELVKKHFNPRIKYSPFKYGTLNSLLGDEIQTLSSGNHFLIGNSATTTNNHLEAFSYLQKINLNGRKVFVPLSYGDNNYAEHVIKHGTKLWGKDFIPLQTFMPLMEYNKIFNSCGNVIMNHYRQQGMGNIITALWKGAKVFLNQKNPIYQHLHNRGFLIYSLDKINTQHNISHNEVQIQQQRDKLMQIYNTENVLNEVGQLVKYLNCERSVKI